MKAMNWVTPNYDLVKAHVSMEQILKHYELWTKMRGSSSQRQGKCPIHGGAGGEQFFVDLKKNIWYCFGDCKAGGNVLDLVAAIERCSVTEATAKLNDLFLSPTAAANE